MTSNEDKDQTESNRQSGRFESLGQPLRDQENGNTSSETHDNDGVAKNCNRFNNGNAGLVDVTNLCQPTIEHITCQHEKKFGSSSSHDGINNRKSGTKPRTPLAKNKKYIWDEWEAVSGQVDTKQVDLFEEENDGQNASATQAEKALAARQKLLDLKAASEEIKARIATLKKDQEKLKDEVDDLHSIRITNEANHIKTMKQIKREHKERKVEIDTKNKQLTQEQENAYSELTISYQKLKKKETHFTTELEQIIISEKNTCVQLQEEYRVNLQQCKRSWQKAEETDLKRREKKILLKLKKDAAKAVEPKLRKLVEINSEELSRLQRQSAREIDAYKLELFSKTNREFKIETDKIRETERSREEKLEYEWTQKLSEMHSGHCAELEMLTKDSEQRKEVIKQRYNINKQRLVDEHKAAMEDAQTILNAEREQITTKHKQTMASRKNSHKDEVTNRDKANKLELESWKAARAHELLEIEENELKRAEVEVRKKAQADIDTVVKKLNEETHQKRHQKSLEVTEKIRCIKAAHEQEIEFIQAKLNEAEAETTALRKQDDEAKANLLDHREKISTLKASLYEKEDQVLIQESLFETIVAEYDRAISDKKREAEHKISLARTHLHTLESELDNLICTRPQQDEHRKDELNSLKTQYVEEVRVAKEKINMMLERKKITVKDASAKVVSLQRDIAEIERQIDETRLRKILRDRVSK